MLLVDWGVCVCVGDSSYSFSFSFFFRLKAVTGSKADKERKNES